MTQKHEKESKNGQTKESLKKLGFMLLGLLLAVNTIQLVRFGDIVERVDRYNQGVIDELGGFRGDVASFGGDLNEIREFLLLPTKEYSSTPKEQQEEGNEPKASRTETALFTFMEQIAEEQNQSVNKEKAIALATTLHDDAGFVASLVSAALTIGKVETNDLASSFKVNDAQGNGIFAINVDLKKATVSVQSSLGKYAVKDQTAEGVKKELLSYFENNKDQAVKMKTVLNEQKEGIKAIRDNNDVKALLTEKKATIEEAVESEEGITYPILNNDKEKVLEIQIQRKDGTILFNEKSYATAPELLQPLLDTVKNTDMSSVQEQLINSKKAELQSIFGQEAFKEMLKNSGLELNQTPREDYNKLLYDVKKGDKVIFSFAIEMSSGSLKIIKDDQEIDLFSILSEGSKKKP